MMRSKAKFYWSDALYDARAKEWLSLMEDSASGQLYRCRACQAFVRFSLEGTTRSGRWERVRPFDHFQLVNRFSPASMAMDHLNIVSGATKDRALFQCAICTSYWWKADDGWTKADDRLIDL